MFRRFLLLGTLVLLTPSFVLSDNRATLPEKLSWLNDHNRVRCEANAQTMPALIWDEALERVAQDWVNTHPLSHNQQRSTQYRALTRDRNAQVGENLAAGYATFLLADKAWADEKPQMGGHYTQMVWANTLRVGCARSNTTAPPYGNYYICNYYPPGNYVGQKPFVPAGGPNPNADACLKQNRTGFLPTMTFPPGTTSANNGVLVNVSVNGGTATSTTPPRAVAGIQSQNITESGGFPTSTVVGAVIGIVISGGIFITHELVW